MESVFSYDRKVLRTSLSYKKPSGQDSYLFLQLEKCFCTLTLLSHYAKMAVTVKRARNLLKIRHCRKRVNKPLPVIKRERNK